MYFHLHSSNSLSCRHQWFSSLQLKVNIQQHFAVKLLTSNRQSVFNRLLWCNIQPVNRTLLNHLTLVDKTPFHTIVAKIAEEVFVVNSYLALLEINWTCPDILIFVSNFISVWIQLTVRTNHTITVEIII